MREIREAREKNVLAVLLCVWSVFVTAVTNLIRAIAKGNVTGVQETFHLSCFQPGQNPTYYGTLFRSCADDYVACEMGSGCLR